MPTIIFTASQSFHLFRHGSKLKGKKQLKWLFSNRCRHIRNFRTVWDTLEVGNVLNKTRHSNPIIYKERRRKIFVQQEDPLRGKGNELMEKRGKTSLEKKWMWRIAGNPIFKSMYQGILKIWTHGNSPDIGSVTGHPCKTNFNGFSTIYNKFYGANSYL